MRTCRTFHPSVHRGLTGAVAAIVAASLVCSGATAATAANSESAGDPIGDVAEPVEVQTEASGAAVTSTASGGAESEITFVIPGDVTGEAVELESAPTELRSGKGSPIITTAHDGALLTSYESSLGVQTLIKIPDAAAPVEYAFPFDLPGSDRLELQADGSVFMVDVTGTPTAMLDVPWAFDADGNAVSTSFRVEGNSVIQTIDTSTVTSFPVIADPDLWFVIANSAGCLAEIAGLSLVGAKAVQVFAKADKVIRAAKALGKYYDLLGGKVDKVIGVFKKWINNRKSLTRAQLSALEGLMREGAKIFFNALGLGSCFALVRGS